MTEADAICLREHFHAEGNRFGMMARHHRDEAAFKLGDDAKYHIALADKWALGQHLSYTAASAVTTASNIPEYGRAWDEQLMPDDLRECKLEHSTDGPRKCPRCDKPAAYVGVTGVGGPKESAGR